MNSPPEARYPSGKGEVCKTFMRRFDPDPRLQIPQNLNNCPMGLLKAGLRIPCFCSISSLFERKNAARSLMRSGTDSMLTHEKQAQETGPKKGFSTEKRR